MKELAGRVAVITGAGSGIGRGMAVAFAEAGMKVVVSDIEPESARAVAAEVGGLSVATDVSKYESVVELADRAFSEFGEVHVLCNNAGVALAPEAHKMTIDDWRWLMGVNLDGVIHGLTAFLPRMQAQPGEKHVVNTASIAGHVPLRGHIAYCASKFAVVGMTEVLRIEGADYNMGATVVCPGMVRTRILESARNRPGALPSTTWQDINPEIIEMIMTTSVDPVELGRQVRGAVERNELYVFTQPEMHKPIVEGRVQGVLAGFGV